MRRYLLRLANRGAALAAALPLILPVHATAAVPSQRDQAHIRAIEKGLLPATVIKGRGVPSMTLADRMKFYGVPAVSIAFFDHGQIVWAKAYGYADIAAGRPATPETLFQAGSISKPIAALGALRLVQDRRLDLDQDVNLKLESWKVPENEFTATQKVTLRRILGHTAGLTVHGFLGYPRDAVRPSLVQELAGVAPSNTAPVVVQATPGSTWAYSGGGYTVMQLLMGEATGKAFPDLMQTLVFGPLGLGHTTYEEPLPASRWSEAATGYLADGSPVPGNWRVIPEMAAAGLWTTPSDLARLAIDVQAAYAGRSAVVLDKPTAQLMLTPGLGSWGLGWDVQPIGGRPHFQHGGDDPGFEADLQAYRDTGTGIAIMTNGAKGANLISEIMRSVAKEYGWPGFDPKVLSVAKVKPRVLASYAGRYDIPGVARFLVGTAIIVSTERGRLYVQSKLLGATPVEALPQSQTRFVIPETGGLPTIEAEFVKDGRTGASKLVVHAGAETMTGTRLP